MYEIPGGGGARSRELHFTFLCYMGVPCSTSNKLKKYIDRNVMLEVLNSLIQYQINKHKLVLKINKTNYIRCIYHL